MKITIYKEIKIAVNSRADDMPESWEEDGLLDMGWPQRDTSVQIYTTKLPTTICRDSEVI